MRHIISKIRLIADDLDIGDWVERIDDTTGEVLLYSYDDILPESLKGQPIRGKIVGKKGKWYLILTEWDIIEGDNNPYSYLRSEFRKINYKMK